MTAGSERVEFATRDPDEGAESMAVMLGGRPRMRPPGDSFAIEVSMRLGDRVSAGRMTLHADVVSEGESLDRHIVVLPRAGVYRLLDHHPGVDAVAGGALLMRAGVLHEVRVEQVAFDVVTVDAALLDQVVAIGGGRRRTAQRPAPAPVEAGLGRHLQRTARWFVTEVLDQPEVFASPLLRVEGERLVATAVAAAFGFAEPADGGVDGAGPVVLRRARAFMEEHALAPITVADIAAAAGVSPRGLQELFRRLAGVSPTSELRRMRLAGAREELLRGDPASLSVIAVAHRWGFGDVARFSARYRDEYGEWPSATLER